MSTLITDIGLVKINNATGLDQLNITHMAVGDGNGISPVFDGSATSLVNEVFRKDASAPIRDPLNPDNLIFEMNIADDERGFTVREIGLFDVDGDLIAVGDTEVTVKGPSSRINLTERVIIRLQNAAQVDVFYDNQGAIDFEGLRNRNASALNTSNGSNVQAELDKRATDEALWGDRFVGYFADGFVYASDSDIAKGSDGNYYRYIGSSAYPVTVTAGTDESDSNYALVNASQKKEFKTVSDAINYVNINSLLGSKISTVEYYDGKGYGGSNYEVVLTSSVTPNGMDIIQSASKSDYSIKLIVDLSCNITNFGFKTDDVTSDAGIYIQRMVDSGAYKIAEHVLPSGIVYWGTTVLSHAIPLKLTGKGSQRTEVIPSSSCQFDTNRIPVEVDLPLEYECNALIVITRFNGESNNSTSTQRDIDIGGFSYNASGTAFERQVGIIFAGGISHSGWHDIYHTAADYVYFAKNMSDGDSRHFYVTFKKCRGQDSNSG